MSTPSVVLTGYPPTPRPDLAGGVYPTWVPPHQGTPQQGTPPAGYPLAGYPPPPPAAPGRVPLPPRCLPHGILGNVAKHYGIWYPPRCGLTNKVKLLPSRRTTYAGGKNSQKGSEDFSQNNLRYFPESVDPFSCKKRSTDAPLCLNNILSMDNLILKRADLIIGTY